MKKSREIILIVTIFVLIIGGIVGTYFIIKNIQNNNNIISNSNKQNLEKMHKSLIDELKLKETINKSLIELAKKDELSNKTYYAKYFELGRVENGNSLDVYVWAQYGRADENKKMVSGMSVPVKLTISLNDYSLIKSDVVPDDTNYAEYFPAVAEKFDGIEFKNKDVLYGETYYE